MKCRWCVRNKDGSIRLYSSRTKAQKRLSQNGRSLYRLAVSIRKADGLTEIPPTAQKQ